MFLKHSSFCVHLDYPKIVVSPAAAVIFLFVSLLVVFWGEEGVGWGWGWTCAGIQGNGGV